MTHETDDVWLREDAPLAHERALMRRGYRPWYASVDVVRPSLADVTRPDHLMLRPLAELGTERTLALLGRVLHDTRHRRYQARPAAAVLARLVALADGDTAAWSAILRDEVAIGLVLPRPASQTLALVGLVPEARGQGLGREAHRLGLWILAQAGADRYRDATDIRNTPMLRTFQRNGCRPTGMTRWYRRQEV